MSFQLTVVPLVCVVAGVAARLQQGFHSAPTKLKDLTMTEEKKGVLPFGLRIIGIGVMGCETELFSSLEARFTSEELSVISENAMGCIGDHWRIPECGSAMWVLYKRVCGKDLDKFAEAVKPENSAASREQIRTHLL